MTINKVRLPGLLSLVALIILSIPGLPSSFDTRAGTPEIRSSSKEEILKALVSYRSWNKVNASPILLRADELTSVGV